ncbi:MAG: hypothetical protein GY786_04155 [Proteobacteria bacterium]|nr:hypothetical protein [Pseudomonadota bacterium]
MQFFENEAVAFIVVAFPILIWFWGEEKKRKRSRGWKRRNQSSVIETGINARKPDWVAKEVIRLRVYLPHYGCRKIADSFNRRHFGRESVSKSYVADLL